MKESHPTQQLYEELQQIAAKAGHENLLEALTKKARNIEIKKREEFENALLSLAQKTALKEIRPVLYEAMVSLQSIWNQYLPKKDLQKEFWAAIKAGDTENAIFNYRELTKQGLDYIGTFQKREGELIPIYADKEYILLQYNEKELTFYNLQLEELANIPVQESLKIIDIMVLSPITDMELVELSVQKDLDIKMWILMEGKGSKKSIISTNLDEIRSLKNIDTIFIEQRASYLDGEKGNANHLSYYKDHLLIVSNSAIYYREGDDWKEWYTTRDGITACQSTGKGVWVGHATGDVIILKDLERVGIRDNFNIYSETIKSIRRLEEFILIFCKKSLCITDHMCNSILGPIKTDSEIVQTTILNKESVLIHLANGMLTARELKQGNICWQINLDDVYEIILPFRQYIYCGKREGEVKIFEIPLLTPMAKELESKKIYVDSQAVEAGPDAPVKYISEFIGRKELLNEIKETGNAHFLLYGEPRIGKTSLLNVLRDTLSEIAKCCYIDMAQLLKDAHSYVEVEGSFIEKCLGQHFMELSELHKKEGYLALREMVKEIKGDRKFCVFCLDNFYIPNHFSENNLKKFKTFLRSMLIHPEVRIIMTCNLKVKDNITKCFDAFMDILSQRKLLERQVTLFSEMEVKNALRKKVSLDQDIVNEIYKYIGRFPHLVHLYDKWNAHQYSIADYSKIITKESSDKIVEYFRDLSPDAYLLIATCLRYNLLSEQNSYRIFYESFSFLNSILPIPLLDQALKEIDNYGDGFFAGSDPGSFHISLQYDTRLFKEASRHISWLNDFSTLFTFTSSPDLKRAHSVAQTFTQITRSELDAEASLLMEKYKEIFYVNKLTDEGREVLDMPLTTFIVIPLQPWKTDPHKKAFNDLYVSIQEFTRVSIDDKSNHEKSVQKFYILLFELHGVFDKKVKEDLIGLERISVIDASKMKNIILDQSPRQKASEYIFDQLSIKERSPYTTAGAVPDELFFGREMEIQLIRGLPENIGIFGTRTIGKTSLLRRLNKDMKSQTKWKVYAMDCSRINSEKVLLENLAEKMDIAFESIPDMEEFRKYITREVKDNSRQYLFLLDEVDRLVQYDIHHDEKIFNTFNRLCTEVMKDNESAVRFILCGFQQMFEQMKNPVSRLYNFMVFLPLKLLDITSALALVTQPIEKIRVRWKDKKDALYLVNSCSCHPRLLQAACHSLLSILDGKAGKKDVIEREDVEEALTSAEFREMCMRFYYNPAEEKVENTEQDKKVERKKTLLRPFSRARSKDKEPAPAEKPKKGKDVWNDLHRITILSAIRLLFEESNESFTITDIHSELKRHIEDISPNVMRIILDHLCLGGIFNLKNESMLLARRERDIQKKVAEKQIKLAEKNFEVGKPDVYFMDNKTVPKFIYEFGVKIFPTLLVAHFGGIGQCKEELQKLVEKKDWEEWLRRY